MRPSSEIHSAISLIDNDLSQSIVSLSRDLGHSEISDLEQLNEMLSGLTGPASDDIVERLVTIVNLQTVHAVLSWVAGEEVPDGGELLWLSAYLLDDPPKLDDVPPETN